MEEDKNIQITNLKINIFSRAKIFIENIGEFAPFGAKLINSKIIDIVFYNDKDEILNTENEIKIIQENLIIELNNLKIHAAAFAFDVEANFKDLHGISKKRDALCLKISTDGKSWSEEYFPYKIVDCKCVWT